MVDKNKPAQRRLWLNNTANVRRILFGIEIATLLILGGSSAFYLHRAGASWLKWIPGLSLLLGWAVWKLLETRK